MSLAAFLHTHELWRVDVSKSRLLKEYQDDYADRYNTWIRYGSDDYETIDGVHYLRYAAEPHPEEILVTDVFDIPSELGIAGDRLVVALIERDAQEAHIALADLAVAWHLETELVHLQELEARDIEPLSELSGLTQYSSYTSLLIAFQALVGRGEYEELDKELEHRLTVQEIHAITQHMLEGCGPEAAQFLALPYRKLQEIHDKEVTHA